MCKQYGLVGVTLRIATGSARLGGVRAVVFGGKS